MGRVIQIDSREHLRERRRIEEGFDKLGVQHICSKLYVGDYCFVDNPLIVVDRKMGLAELANNVTGDHGRFRQELIKAREIGAQLTILCEFSMLAPSSLEDVRKWVNPRLRVSPAAVKGETLYKILRTMGDRYGVQYEFCMKKDTPKKILEILSRERQ